MNPDGFDFNAVVVSRRNSWADYFPDADLAIGIALKRGLNVWMMKVTNKDRDHPEASIRFTDAEKGAAREKRFLSN